MTKYKHTSALCSKHKHLHRTRLTHETYWNAPPHFLLIRINQTRGKHQEMILLKADQRVKSLGSHQVLNKEIKWSRCIINTHWLPVKANWTDFEPHKQPDLSRWEAAGSDHFTSTSCQRGSDIIRRRALRCQAPGTPKAENLKRHQKGFNLKNSGPVQRQLSLNPPPTTASTTTTNSTTSSQVRGGEGT